MKEARKLAELAPKIMNAFHDLGREHGSGDRLSIRQYQALIILNANNTLTLSQLCKKLKLAPSTGTELVNRMIALKYVRKSQTGGDQRQVTLSLTLKGIELLKQREEALTGMFARFLAPFPPDKATDFVNAFESIWNSIVSYHINNK
jgi:DNA-binding MarR family transcriptional regulator